MRVAPVALLLAACASTASAADADHPVVVELFQSQGCSSCPPANASLNAIAGRADVLALSFAVTYWDQLGWKDGFAQPAFTARQWDYARAGRRPNVATPQMIVNGRGVLVGSDPARVAEALRRHDRGAGGPAIRVAPGRVAIGPAQAGVQPATVWLVRYDPRIIAVAVRAGENAGRTLPHRNIVRALMPLGRWNGTAMSFAVPPGPDAAWRTAVLVQQGSGGPIVAARRL
ncbi:DUF1223 domain-containing protein [Sphingomonas solaris]|uniref:DUF1223 domain-containing protein n=1 Tax=Alterirhizorhabdus solaris TaxID=2529389 RepID=UPI001EF034F1|nr:DUF1223 domain-containing protein [Sphingomonas solaris]